MVRIWSETGDLLHTLTDHPHPITGLAWSPEGYLATADENGLLLVWDARLSVVPDALESCALRPLGKSDRQIAGLGPAQPRILSPAARPEVEGAA